MLKILAVSGLTTVQDRGRPGFAHMGVPASGVLDRGAAALANRLVGNPPDAAVLEVTFGGLRFRVSRPARLAVTGAPAPLRAGARPLATDTLHHLPGAVEVDLGSPSRGVRNYVALGGGIAAPQTLGSRSTDLLSGLGPAPLRAGDVLDLGPPPPFTPAVGQAPVARIPDVLVLRLREGPRADWFTRESVDALATSRYLVSPDSNRIGVRLDGPPLARRTGDELPSEGMVLGAVEVPHDGQPVILLADHPTTGGYPVVAVVHPADLDLLAQARPGAEVRLRFASRP